MKARRGKTAVDLTLVVASVALLSSACQVGSVTTGDTKHETAVIELDKSDAAHIALRMGAGELDVAGGTAKFADAEFIYNVPAWKPDVVYHSGELTISQPGGSNSSFGRTENKWHVKLNERLPLD